MDISAVWIAGPRAFRLLAHFCINVWRPRGCAQSDYSTRWEERMRDLRKTNRSLEQRMFVEKVHGRCAILL